MAAVAPASLPASIHAAVVPLRCPPPLRQPPVAAGVAPAGSAARRPGVAALMARRAAAVPSAAAAPLAAGAGGRAAAAALSAALAAPPGLGAALAGRSAAADPATLIVDGESKGFDTSAKAHRIHPFAEEQGIQFSCIEGTCGTCAVEVKKGADLLNDLTKQEVAFFGSKESAGDKRLACQAEIKQGAKGEVEVEK